MVSKIGEWIRGHRVASFFILAYAVSWSLDAVVLVLGMEPSWTRWIVSGFLSALGPAIAAGVVLSISGESLRNWLGRVGRWRVHPKWYAAAIGIPLIVALGSGAVLQLVGGPVDFASFAFAPVSLGIGIILGTAIGGGQEELGWRGFAQPELQEQYGGLRAAVILGVLWGGWHLPLFLDPTAIHSQWPPSSQLAYFVGIVAFSILLAWVYNGSGGSTLLAMLMHGTENAAGGLVPLDLGRALVEGVPNWVALAPMNVSHAVLLWLFALVVISAAGTGLLARRERRA
ncbi:CPBP family intramembrane metalloprotease [Halobellus sp. Atlit-31R]|nr:CPBP family intramembrane metalloprotease [Halobellus sp. Atlit-31R]